MVPTDKIMEEAVQGHTGSENHYERGEVIKESKTSEIIDFGEVIKVEKLFQALTTQYDEFIQHTRDECAHDRESNDHGTAGNVTSAPTGSEAVSECIDRKVPTMINFQNKWDQSGPLK